MFECWIRFAWKLHNCITSDLNPPATEDMYCSKFNYSTAIYSAFGICNLSKTYPSLCPENFSIDRVNRLPSLISCTPQEVLCSFFDKPDQMTVIILNFSHGELIK